MFRIARTPLDLPLALFLVSALIGVWASYDPATSWSRFGLIVLAVAIYYLVVWSSGSPDHWLDWLIGRLAHCLSWIVWSFLVGSAALAVYFVTQHDYSSGPNKFEPIAQVGLFLNGLSPQLSGPRVHPNNAAGILEIGVPVGFALALQSARVRSPDQVCPRRRPHPDNRGGGADDSVAWRLACPWRSCFRRSDHPLSTTQIYSLSSTCESDCALKSRDRRVAVWGFSRVPGRQSFRRGYWDKTMTSSMASCTVRSGT